MTTSLSENGNGAGVAELNYLLSQDMPYDQWIPLNIRGWCPSARYKHAAEVVGGRLYVVGGSCNGRYLSDIQEFNVMTSTWTQERHAQDSNFKSKKDERFLLSAIAGHSLVKWEEKLLVVAGNSKIFSDTVTVWSIDLTSYKCISLKTHGDAPIAREGQSATLVGSKLILFGGEDNKRQLLNDLHILDLETLSWNIAETKNKPPGPRSDHTAAAYEDRYLLIFGGTAHSFCFNDLHILDLHNMEWSEIQIQGEQARPRAGHAGAILGESWYIVGGGDNMSGAQETIKVNMSKLVLEVVTIVSPRDALASEGLSLCSTTLGGENFLLAFGGYNGKYHNEVYVLKAKPTISAPPRILRSSAAAAAAASVTAVYALTSENPPVESTNEKKKDLKEIEPEPTRINAADITAANMEKKKLESKLWEAKEGNLRLRNELNECTNSFEELTMELHSIQGQLTVERSRCSDLELQIAYMHKRLESQKLIEQKLEIFRSTESSRQEDLLEMGRQSSGVWQWMRGSS